MKIEIYADIHCPFCYLGKRRLEADLAKIPGGEQVEILYRAYVLDPHAPNFSGKSVYQAQADRKGMAVEKIQAAYGEVAKTGLDFGIVFKTDATVPTNTIEALALVQYAQTKGRQVEVMEKLFAAYYTDGENISDPAVLERIATEAGLEGAMEALATGEFQTLVRQQDAEARAQKIEGIPYFIVNGKETFFGSDQTAKVVEALLPRPKLQEIKVPPGMVCEGGACRVN